GLPAGGPALHPSARPTPSLRHGGVKLALLLTRTRRTGWDGSDGAGDRRRGWGVETASGAGSGAARSGVAGHGRSAGGLQTMSAERDLGVEALQCGDGASAIRHLERACSESPDDFRAHLYLGGAYGQQNRPEDAVRALTRALELQPTSAQAQYNLGVALERAGRIGGAAAAHERALALQPA